MPSHKQTPANPNENAERQWKGMYTLGGITALIVIAGTILDILLGTIMGGDLSAIPKTAVDRFAQFQNNPLLGLYNLDLLNLCTSVLIIPTYFALYAAHRRIHLSYVKLALLIFAIGTAVFAANNTALPMLALSRNYSASTVEAQRNLLAAAGEAMLARGAHGSPGAFPGFILSSIASIIMSVGMLKGRIFSKANAYFGILGGILLMVYLILVTFVPAVETAAMMIAAPGGLLSLAWIIMFTIRLFKLRRAE